MRKKKNVTPEKKISQSKDLTYVLKKKITPAAPQKTWGKTALMVGGRASGGVFNCKDLREIRSNTTKKE